MPDQDLKDRLCRDISDRLLTTFGDQYTPGERADLAQAFAVEHLRLGADQHRLIDRPLLPSGDDAVYPIHDADLKLIDEATAVAAALGAVAGSVGLGLLAKLAAFLYRLRRKRARVAGDVALVLLTLTRAPNTGWMVGQVKDQLKAHYGQDRSEDAVRAALQSLQDVRLEDGTRTKFADEQQGFWFTVDV